MSALKIGARASDLIDDYNALIYIINSVVKKVNTVELVRVEAVNQEEKTVTIIPIVQDANAEGNRIPVSPIQDIRYIRWQYGGNAIKATPEVGDIGMVVICKKDISNAEEGIIATHREYCIADGIYIGGIFGLNQEPTQFVEFTEEGINITSPNDINLTCLNANINATTSATITSPIINLGGEGGQPVARVGDDVVSGTTVIGQIGAGSAIVKAL